MPRPTAEERRAAELRDEMGFLTERETAALLGKGLKRLRNMASAGTAPPRYKVGLANFYKRDEVVAWITRRRVQA